MHLIRGHLKSVRDHFVIPVIRFVIISLFGFESIRNDLYWTSRKISLELIELSSINKVSLV